MGWLMACGPIMQVQFAHALLTGIAMDETAAGDPRTMSHLRFDALVDAVLRSGRPTGLADGAEAASLRPVRVGVTLTVPALTLLGQSDEPAVIEHLPSRPKSKALRPSDCRPVPSSHRPRRPRRRSPRSRVERR